MKELYWLGTSLDDLKAFPADARREAGTDLRLVQQGAEPRDWKPMKDVGKGTREIRVRADNGAFRVFYVVESEVAVYVLHAFQKKTQKTAKADIEKGQSRYRLIP
ncbi:MAG: type II toxin-antitoxin system RelE/ParE family toxin [Pseudoxanthomonas sp.]